MRTVPASLNRTCPPANHHLSYCERYDQWKKCFTLKPHRGRRARAAITGSFTVTINSSWPSTDVMAMGVTPNWGTPSTSYIDLGGFSTPVTGLQSTIDLNLTAPSTPGTYYIIAAFEAEYTAGEVMSCTNWQVGYLDWSTGYAVADWATSTIKTADKKGPSSSTTCGVRPRAATSPSTCKPPQSRSLFRGPPPVR